MRNHMQWKEIARVLIALIALNAMAQVTASEQASPLPKGRGFAQARQPAQLPAPRNTVRIPLTRSHTKRQSAGTINPNNLSFLSAVTYFSGGGGAMSVAVADLNGDGKPDLVVLNATCFIPGCSDEGVDVLLGNGDGTFQTAVS